MNVEIITIGDELLIGQIVDTNSAWIARELTLIGISVVHKSSVADNKIAILNALKEAENRADLILVTGGLGPTKDDITKIALCEYFSTVLTEDMSSLNNIKDLFTRKGLELSEKNRHQAWIPQTCTPIQNNLGTAPGMWFNNNNKQFIFMPGVPFEMEGMMCDSILPAIDKKSDVHILQKHIITHGIGESWLADMIEDLEDMFPGVKLAYLPSLGYVKLRITTKGNNIAELEKRLISFEKLLSERIDKYILGVDAENIETLVGKLLVEKNKTIAVAESCSGGYLSHKITSVSGSSNYFKGGVVSYSNVIKVAELNVIESDLDRCGAVSEQIVKQMAEGIRKKYKVDYGIATSGIAGPNGGTFEKPVGTVWVAVASNKTTVAENYLFSHDRLRNIELTTVNAIAMLIRQLSANDKS